jgi:hypothetical protein
MHRGSQQLCTTLRLRPGTWGHLEEKIRKRIVCEVTSFVRLFKKAGILVSFLDGRKREIPYDPRARRWPP